MCAAISGILYEAKRALKAGRIVRLSDLGSLQIGLNSEGAVSVKEFSSSLLRLLILFSVPERRYDITKILSYQQVTTRAVAQTGGSGNEGEDDKGSGGGSDGGGSGEAPIRQHDNFNIGSNERNCN